MSRPEQVQDVIQAVLDGPSGPRIGAFIDLDGLVDGYTADVTSPIGSSVAMSARGSSCARCSPRSTLRSAVIRPRSVT